MNTMPFPDGSQEVPRSLLVALPEFRLNPLNGRTAPIPRRSRAKRAVPKAVIRSDWPVGCVTEITGGPG